MDMLPSLCAAMVRANGDSLVLESGCPPYVLTDAGRTDVAKATLSDTALDALVGQIFSESAREAFRAHGHATERVDVPSSGLLLTASADRRDHGIVITLSKTPLYDLPPMTPEPAVDESLFAAPEHPMPAAEQLQGWEATPGIFAGDGAAEDLGWTPSTDVVSAEPRIDAPPLEGWDQIDVEVPLGFDAPSEVAAPPEPEPDVALDAEDSQYLEASPQNAAVVPALTPTPASPRLVEMPLNATTQPDTDLRAWAAEAADKGATTLYLRAGSAPVARVEDRLDPVGSSQMDQVQIDQLIGDLEGGGDPSWQRGHDGDWVRLDATLGRIACRVFSDDLGRGIILRLQPPASARGLHRLVPRQVRAACDGDGLIVVSAPTADESLALAGTVADIAGRRRGGYVIALRPNGAPRPQVSGAFVSQREFSPQGAQASIRAAVAEGPDILLLTLAQGDGSARDIARASEGARLVVLSVAAPTSIQAVRTLLGRGTSVADAQLRLALAGNFRAAFATRTMRRLGGGRTVVQDLLLGTTDVASLLASGDYAGLTRLQRQGASGMFTVDERLARSIRRGRLTLRQGVEASLDRRHLVALVRSSGRSARLAAQSLDAELQPVAAAGSVRWASR